MEVGSIDIWMFTDNHYSYSKKHKGVHLLHGVSDGGGVY